MCWPGILLSTPHAVNMAAANWSQVLFMFWRSRQDNISGTQVFFWTTALHDDGVSVVNPTSRLPPCIPTKTCFLPIDHWAINCNKQTWPVYLSKFEPPRMRRTLLLSATIWCSNPPSIEIYPNFIIFLPDLWLLSSKTENTNHFLQPNKTFRQPHCSGCSCCWRCNKDHKARNGVV